MYIHKNTFPNPENLGEVILEFQPTYDFKGNFIDSYHRFLGTSPLKNGLIYLQDRRRSGSPIQGWLRREDALKLFEMAFFAQGDILELGSYHGLSTTILSKANHNSHHHNHIYTVDIDPECIKQTSNHLQHAGLARDVTSICADALIAVRQFIESEHKFVFAFIDHSHAYQHVYPVCLELKNIITTGGFCLFHDFNDARNKDSEDHDYGVYQAVIEGMKDNEFEFYGVYGCTALYRRI
jgi:predicted O-methyltransferase YrrM